jgi:hypothetical protein
VNLKTALSAALDTNPDKSAEGLAALRRLSLKTGTPQKERVAVVARLLLIPFGDAPGFDVPTMAQALVDAGAPKDETIRAATLPKDDPLWQPAAQALAAWGHGK